MLATKQKDYCPGVSSADRDAIAACPAAVAASLERFLSASAMVININAFGMEYKSRTHQLPFLVQFLPR
jgi:hypothetical protein